MSALDMTLLRALKHRGNYEKWRRGVPETAIQAATKIMLDDYGAFFKANPEAQAAHPEAFIPFFKLSHPKLKDDKLAIYNAMQLSAGEEVPDEVMPGMGKLLQDAATAVDLTTALEKYNNGEEIDLTQHVRHLSDRIPPGGSKIEFVRPDIHALLSKADTDWGFRWRTTCMNEAMRPLGEGDFGIMAARVDVGKTTWLLSEATFMAPQVDVLYPGENKIILYLNNEGLGERLYQRSYNSLLQTDVDGLITLSKAGTLDAAYIAAQGGRDVLYIVDVHDRPLSYLEEVVSRTNPALVIVDMLDVVPFDGVANNGGTRTDQLIEAAYQRARIWAVKYRCAVIAASQLDATADGEMFPNLAKLANSKTGKPGAADWVAFLGKVNDPMLDNTRYISLPKNKLARPKGRKDPRAAVTFMGAEGLIVDARIA